MPFTDEGITCCARLGTAMVGPERGRNALRNPAVVSGSRRRCPRLDGPPSGFRPPSRFLPAAHADHPRDRGGEAEGLHVRSHPVHLPELLTEDGGDARPMSLATSPTRPNLEYAVRLSDSPYKRAFAALQPEEEVLVFGPTGDFVLHEGRPAILVAGESASRPSKDGRVRGGPGIAHSDPLVLQQPKPGGDRLSRRTGRAGKAERSLPGAPHAQPHRRPRMAGRGRPAPSKPHSASGSQP